MGGANPFIVFLSACAAFVTLQIPAWAVPDYVIKNTNVLSLDRPEEMSTPKHRERRDEQDHVPEAQREAKKREEATRPPERDSNDGVDKSYIEQQPPQPQEKQVAKQPKPYHVLDQGYCLPSGQYHWNTLAGPRIGVVPNPTYAQQQGIAPGQFRDSGYPGVVDILEKLISDESKGTPISNAEFATLVAAQHEAIAELVNDPLKRMHQAQTEATAKQSDAANNAAECAEGSGDMAFLNITHNLINVANEEAGTPTDSRNPFKSYSQAIWMVQQMYKKCFIPMAILFLLPGAVLTQVKSLVSFGVMHGRDEDCSSPFSGILRAMIAIFLIPATQLTVSYVIDIGNSVTQCVTQELNRHGGLESIYKWSHEQTYSNAEKQYQNFIKNDQPARGEAEIGKISGKPEDKMLWEHQTNLSTTMQMWFNTLNNVLAQGLIIINAFQTVMICYLFLLGPIAASFFAWPSGVGKDLFRKTFASWLDGVVVLCLWKFWWNVCLLCMAIRLSSGYVTNPTDEWEMFMFTAFMAILTFVPFNPFEFRPGEIVSHVLEKAQQHAGKAGQTGAGSGAGGGGNGGAGPGGASGPVGAKHSKAES